MFRITVPAEAVELISVLPVLFLVYSERRIFSCGSLGGGCLKGMFHTVLLHDVSRRTNWIFLQCI